MQAYIHFGEASPQAGYFFRQDIARLRMGGGYRQGAAVFLAELLANPLEVAQLSHDQVNAFQYMLAGLCNAFEAFAVAGKDVDAQFLFQLNNGLGNPRLRCVQGFRRFCEVQLVAHSFLDKAKLVKVHNEIRLKNPFIMH